MVNLLLGHSEFIKLQPNLNPRSIKRASVQVGKVEGAHAERVRSVAVHGSTIASAGQVLSMHVSKHSVREFAQRESSLLTTYWSKSTLSS